ncbi:MAG: hypothetical protein HY298_14750 [Verrucomicrobia bacterium]|nr:hypothetical protein [Verrucomicrobiota bacterium]
MIRFLSSRRRTFAVLLVVGFLLGAAYLLLKPESPRINAGDFVATTTASVGVPPNATLMDRIFITWTSFSRRFRRPGSATSATYSFPPNGTNLCSIHGLLNQCMEISGSRYLIANEVAAGTVLFGHTNVLNGAQWVKAFEDALRTGTPEWFDPKAKSFRKEKLVLVRHDQWTVLVLPKEKALQFQGPAAANQSAGTIDK